MDVVLDLEQSPIVETSESLLWLLRATKAASIGAFVVQCFEFFNNIPEEIDYLWRTPKRLVTYLYAWSRYFPLISQIVNLALSEIIQSNPKPNLCVASFISKAITAQLMTTCVETILMIRVHALYNCSWRIGLFLVLVMLIGTSMEIMGSTMSISKLEPGPKGTICIPKRSSVETLLPYAIGCVLIQATVFVMTVSKVMLHRKTGWMRTPVVSLMLRDGFGVFLMLTIIVAVVVTFEVVRNEGVLVWNVAFSWYVTLLSVVGCRLVLNIRKLTFEHRNRQYASNSTGLTSVFEEDLYFSGTSMHT